MNLKSTLLFLLNHKKFSVLLKKSGKNWKYDCVEDIYAFQVYNFNKTWKDAFTNFEFYRNWKEKFNLPDEIEDLEDLVNWPILKKKDIQNNFNSLLRIDCSPTSFIQTGGSTGEPLRLPTWPDQETGPNMWLGRAAYDIFPGDKTFLIWGHHHLLGKGFRKRLNALSRLFKDWLSNMYRVSAYDLSTTQMRKLFNFYIKYSPEFVIGFSPAILSFVRANSDFKEMIISPPKAVLCTAGPLSEDEKNEIEFFFNAPVCMEYGSVECGVMAYTVPDKNLYKVFWDTHLIQGLKDEFGEIKNIVTRLTPCYFPLIRYDVGDYLEVDKEKNLISILKLKKIKGRPSDMVKLNNGTIFFGALIGDCVKQIKSVLSSQLCVYPNKLEISLVSSEKLNENDFSLIKERMTTVVPGLESSNIIIVQVEELKTTIGGKTPLVIRKN